MVIQHVTAGGPLEIILNMSSIRPLDALARRRAIIIPTRTLCATADVLFNALENKKRQLISIITGAN